VAVPEVHLKFRQTLGWRVSPVSAPQSV
jgi:hypothetical protein